MSSVAEPRDLALVDDEGELPEVELLEFEGETFRAREKIPQMPMLRMAKMARAGGTTGQMGALAAMYDVLKAAIEPDDWQRFEDVADESGADAESLMAVVGEAIRISSDDRPTKRSSASSGGPTSTATTSADASSARAQDTLEAGGRPDLALVHVQAQEARSA